MVQGFSYVVGKLILPFMGLMHLRGGLWVCQRNPCRFIYCSEAITWISLFYRETFTDIQEIKRSNDTNSQEVHTFYQPLIYLTELAHFSQLVLNSFTCLKDSENS